MHAIVVGAGIIGLSTAWFLRRSGAAVTIVDPAPISGATHAAAGMLAPAAEVAWGQSPLYPLMRASAELYPEFAAAVASATGHDLGHSYAETLVCAGDRADLASLRELTALQQANGFETTLLSGSTARELEPSLGPGVCGAVRIPGDHAIDPRRLSAALLSAVSDHLVTQRVTGLVRSGQRTCGVDLGDGGRLEADQVVIAAGAGCNEIIGAPSLPLREVWGEVIRLRLPESSPPLLTRTVRGLVNARPIYVVPRPDGELVLGATSREDGRGGLNAGGVHRLLQDGERLVPGILDAEITDITTRARPGSPDDVPIIGRIDPGCVISTGYFRHGILLAPFGGRLTAELATELASDSGVTCDEDCEWLPAGALDAVSPERFTTPAHIRPPDTDLNFTAPHATTARSRS
ncbi:glycine oxidase ThiO [Brevibacterium sp. GP-SGM9]|uniref:glycine oxidase ThiO n=1 Tax=Brevibacterium sp. GP-SGM9 TaxID=3376990 RepID=UPI0039A6C076